MANTIYPYGYKPNILLLGNGINQGFGSDSWKEMLKHINCNENFPDVDKLTSPNPLQAILVSKNNIYDQLNKYIEDKRKEGCENVLYGSLISDGHRKMLREILSIPFDGILTTNYSYELEMAAQDECVVPYNPRKVRTGHTEKVKRAESRYLLHTFNQVMYEGKEQKIWHIHGEAKHTQSIILGHYQYAKLLQRMIPEVDHNYYETAQEKRKDLQEKSWLDGFILGNMYVLGFGYDISEFDLWWLLDRKYREKAETGKVYFFEPAEEGGQSNERKGLLQAMGAELCTCDTVKPSNLTAEEKGAFYREFYNRAISEIREMVEGNEHG